MSDILDLTSYNPDEIPEGEILPAGTEVEARISRIAKGVDKNGDDYIMPWFEDPSNPNVEDWNDYLPLPSANATDKDNGKRLKRLSAFADSFDIPLFAEQVDLNDQKSKTGYMIVGIGKDQEDNPQNSVKKYLVQS
jgi:hypothetical protein